MGRYKNTGIAHGTNGSPQNTFEKYEHEAKVKFLEKENCLEKEKFERDIQELEKAGVKFTKEEILFCCEGSQTGQLIWLEKGNSDAGLEHILHGDKKIQWT